MSAPMAFADLRNDHVFRRIFATHPELLIALLGDLLGREGPRAIIELEYLSQDQGPEPDGSKPALIDARCRDAAGVVFQVEVSILHVSRFMKRIVYNACRAYTQQVVRDTTYQTLVDVVAVTICDFELWPDEEQAAKGAARVPMVSHFRMAESTTGAEGPGHVKYVFLELPKLPRRQPETGIERWAWLFRSAAEQARIPEILPEDGPHRAALALADLSTFSDEELAAYRRVHEEIDQTRQIAREAELRGRREGLVEGKREGRVEGKREGLIEGKREGIREGKREALRGMVLHWIDKRGIELGDASRARIEQEARIDVLERWAERAALARSIEEILREEPEK